MVPVLPELKAGVGDRLSTMYRLQCRDQCRDGEKTRMLELMKAWTGTTAVETDGVDRCECSWRSVNKTHAGPVGFQRCRRN